MKYAKLLGLLAIAAAALMAFAGAAFATVLTSPAGTTYTSTIKAESQGAITFHNTSLGISLTCKKSTFEGKVEAHGASTTTAGKFSSLTYTECGTVHVTILGPGSFELHSVGGGNATVTTTGTSITINTTSLGISCVYTTSSTDIGLLTGGTPSILDLNSSVFPRTGDSAFCGSSGVLTGSYKITTPGTLLAD